MDQLRFDKVIEPKSGVPVINIFDKMPINNWYVCDIIATTA